MVVAARSYSYVATDCCNSSYISIEVYTSNQALGL